LLKGQKLLKILRPCFIKDSGIFIPFVLEIGLGLVGALGASRLVFIVAIFLVIEGGGIFDKKEEKDDKNICNLVC